MLRGIMVARVQNFSARMPIPLADRSPLPEVGATVHLNRLETFRGFVNGPLVIHSSYYDHFGTPFVNLARDGKIVVCGVSWPMGVEHVERSDSTCHDSIGDTEATSGIGDANVVTRGFATESGGVDCDDRFSDPPSVVGVESLVGPDDSGARGAIRASSPRQVPEPGRDRGTRPGDRQGDLRQPLTCGIVVIVDFMNLLVRAWYAGKPTQTHAVKSAIFTVANTIERLSPEYVIFAMDGGHAERSRLYPNYKAHRTEKPPELIAQIQLAQEAIEAIGWPMIRVVEWEADDVIASLVTILHGHSAGTVICSRDKDLLQLLGKAQVHHPWDTGKWINKKTVLEKYGVSFDQIGDYLALCGDSSDGVPGVAGIGPKTAAELLAKHGNLEAILEAARLEWIPGSAGKKLKACRPEAELSRKLVTLNSGLEIPNDWTDWPALEPRAGWVEELRRLDLGTCVQRLLDIIPSAGIVRSVSPLIEVIHEQRNLSSGGGVSTGVPAKLNNPERRDDIPVVSSSDSVDTIERTEGDGRHQPLVGKVPESSLGVQTGTIRGDWRDRGYIPFDVRIRLALDDAMSRDVTRPDWHINFPSLSDLPPDCLHDVKLRSVYATAWGKSIDSDGPLWKSGSDFYFVEQLAIAKKPFVLPTGLMPSVSSVNSPPGETNTTVIRKSGQATLFF